MLDFLKYALPLALAILPIAAQAQSFPVHFRNCTEFAGEGPIGLTQAQRYVPTGYTLTQPAAGKAAIVIRTTQCRSVQVESTPALPTTLSQIGLNIVSPDGTGTINNLLLLYVSNNPFLVEAFQRAGIPARLDPAITYEYTQDATDTNGVLYGAVPNSGVPAYFLYGTETEPPPNSQQLFVANWWYGPRAAVRQQTTLPSIAFGTASMTFFTSATSDLGQLIGGNAFTNFSLLSLRGEYPSAEMIVRGSAGR